MNVDHPKYLHSVKIKEVVTTATTATASVGVTSCNKVGRRRRMISREASNLSNSSVEAGGGGYHAQEPAAVPFMWESSPGTPKRHIIMRSSNYDHEIGHLFPPLTPPPSYQYKGNKYATTRIRPSSSSCSKKKKENNVNLIQSIFPRLSFKRENSPTMSSSSSTKSSSRPSTSTSSSSSSSSPSSQPRSVVLTPSPIRSRQRLPSYDQYYSATEVEEEEEGVVVGRSGGSPVSTLCFRRFSCCNAKFRGLYSNWF